MNFLNEAKTLYGITIKEDEFLKKHTTLGVGGPADYFFEAKDKKELVSIYRLAVKNNIPTFILGGGSNTLVGDKGFRGLVIKNMVSGFEVLESIKIESKDVSHIRKEETLWTKGLLTWRDLEYEEDAQDGVIVKAEAGTNLGWLINKTLENGITGLQWFARIPGTVGGAVWNNIHGAHKLIGDFIESVEYLDMKDLQIHESTKENLNLSYNHSFFHDNDKLILSAKFKLFYGNKDRAIFTMKEWIKRKSMQPYNSAGCTFSNIDPKDKVKYNLENLSSAYIIDRVLNLKGTAIGGAEIFPGHSNFIVNKNNATANDILELIEMIKHEAKEKIGIELKEEIVKKGIF